MQRFTNILFVAQPIAHSLPALKRAVQLAKRNGAKLSITSVRDELPRTLDNLNKTFSKLQHDDLKSLLEDVNIEDVEYKIETYVGTPFIEIIKSVAKHNYDLVIKPTEGKGQVSNFLFGSTDLHLLRKCPCPVWIIKPLKQKQFNTILAAVDPDPSEKANAELNTLILNLAISLARQEKSELHVLHAWKFPYENSLRNGRARIDISEVEQMVNDARLNYKKTFDNLLSQFDFEGIDLNVHFLKGDLDGIISTLEEQINLDLIIMGTVARTGIPGFFIGNSAEKILSTADSSILAVKPSEFETPIEN